ncbi:hypothetical protein, partial [Mycoplasma marinum]
FNVKYLQTKEEIIDESKTNIDHALKQANVTINDYVESAKEAFDTLKEECSNLKEQINVNVETLNQKNEKQQVILEKYIEEQISVLRDEAIHKVEKEIKSSKQTQSEIANMIAKLQIRIEKIEKTTVNNPKFSKKYNK